METLKAASLGYPRMGLNRELKSVLEKYWQGTAHLKDIDTVATELKGAN